MSEPESKLFTIVQHHSGQNFAVGTMNRESSAALAYGSWYAETMVWAYDIKNKSVFGPPLWTGEGPRDSCRAHLKVVEYLYNNGTVPDRG